MHPSSSENETNDTPPRPTVQHAPTLPLPTESQGCGLGWRVAPERRGGRSNTRDTSPLRRWMALRVRFRSFTSHSSSPKTAEV